MGTLAPQSIQRPAAACPIHWVACRGEGVEEGGASHGGDADPIRSVDTLSGQIPIPTCWCTTWSVRR
jgi:hypothetical protein